MNAAYKVAIVGGGANGISVLNEMVNTFSETSDISNIEITLYEKSGSFGAGLAYGTDLDAHILNMPANSMSAVASDPEHFLKWLQRSKKEGLEKHFNSQSKATEYISRKVFGFYLEEMFQASLENAAKAGIKVNTIKGEVVDVSDFTNQIVITTADGVQEHYDQGMLCIGNHVPTFGKQFKGLPGYFHHAWPEETIMGGIPNNESVCVIGSSLTAVDTLITLQEKGHTGPIKFISRHGILPKVRVLADPYDLKYLNPENILVLTHHGQRKIPLNEMGELFLKELQAAGANIQDFSMVQAVLKDDPLSVLKNDIIHANDGNMPYFPVLKAIDEVIGHLWNALSLEDRSRFMTHYKTLWNAYDYPMPMQNALKVLASMESGQLTVQKGLRDIGYDAQTGEFNIICYDKDNPVTREIITTRYLINATGQGVNIAKFDNALVRNALESGTITPHLLGGVDVDYESCAIVDSRGQVSARLYLIGSLTQGVHFYSNSINENAKCGKRAVRAIKSKATQDLNIRKDSQMALKTEPQNIALFIGSDISSQMMMNELVPSLIDEGYQPFVYFAKHRPSKKPVLPEIKQQGFFERALLAEHVYPYLDKHVLQDGAALHSPAQISAKYGVTVKEIESVNNPDFISELEQNSIGSGVVVRCYQKFGKDIIDYFNREEDQVLWNLHPGILPQYRGVMTYFRSMSDAQSQAGYSLHVIDEEWDAGPVIDVRPEPLDLGQAMLTNYCVIASSGVPIILDNLKKLSIGEKIEAIPQKEEEKAYYTFPTREEMDGFLSKGLRLVDPEYMKAVILENFSVPSTEHYAGLSQMIDEAIAKEMGLPSPHAGLPSSDEKPKNDI